MDMVLRRLKRTYHKVALVTFNTLVLAAVSIGAVLAYLELKQSAEFAVQKTPGIETTESGLFYTDGTAVDNGKRSQSNLAVFDYRAYEDAMSETEISELLDEFYDHSQMGFAYQPFSQYTPRNFSGKYLNVDTDAMGQRIRRTINPVADPGADSIEIFTFGGSTTFGSGVSDKDTWSSQLSQILNARAQQADLNVNIEIVNYGRVGYYPTQELHLLLDILRGGARPEMVIFLNGVNTGRDDDTPRFTGSYETAIDEAQFGPTRGSPVAAAWRSLRLYVASIFSPGTRSREKPAEKIDTGHLVRRFVEFRRVAVEISDLYATHPLFILQPDGHYNYPDHLYGAGRSPTRPNEKVLKTRFYEDMSKENGFVDMTELFAEWGDRKAIIDAAHYSPNFSRFLAEKIALHIDLARLKERQVPNAEPTGLPRRQPR